MNLSRKQNIAQIGQRAPTKRTSVGLATVTEKVPPTAYTRKFVSPNGNVSRIVLATGRTLGGEMDNGYGNIKRAEKLKAGWLPYSHCPITKGYIRAKGETPCDGPDPDHPGDFSRRIPNSAYGLLEDECCPHIEQIIVLRRQEHNERQNEYASQFTGSTDKLVKILEANAQAQAEALIAAKATSQPILGKRAKQEHAE